MTFTADSASESKVPGTVTIRLPRSAHLLGDSSGLSLHVRALLMTRAGVLSAFAAAAVAQVGLEAKVLWFGVGGLL